MAEHRPDVAREAPDWMYAYLAGVVDSTGSLAVSVAKAEANPLGHQIQVRMRFKSNFPPVLGMIDEMAEAHGWSVNMEQRPDDRSDTRMIMSRRENIREALTLIEPFIIGRLEQVRLLLDVILPGLDKQMHYEKESFVELMEAIDEFRAASAGTSRSKYDAAYFRDLWDLN
jgi:hypothetical protein